MPLKVVVVGAGIAGLATAIGFARHGHHVAVYERKETRSEDSGSGIQLQANAMRVLEAWGLKGDVEAIALLNGVTKTRRYDSGDVLGIIPNGGKREQWYALRNDFKIMFYNAAAKCGADIHLGKAVRAVDELRPAVMFEDGSSIEADLVIGADGTRSKVRMALFPDFLPQVRAECVFQVIVPRSSMEKSAATKELYDDPSLQFLMSPGRSIVSSAAPKREIYDMQLIDHEYGFELDDRPELWNERVHDMTWLRRRFGDFNPAIRMILAEAQSYWKWRLTHISVAALSSWTSRNGKIVLVGDSAHAMVPYAGQGAASGIEDAAVLSEIFSPASPQDDLQRFGRLYEEIRRPRIELVQMLAESNGIAFSLPDGSRQRRRDQSMQQRPPNRPEAVPDSKARFGSIEFDLWLDNWDAIQEARKAMTGAGIAYVSPRARL